ncbi:flagellar assembly protein FliH [Enterobacter ludwigii]|uniref:flagellar assembly protein FliH n=1 Tax=Enterobacter ludwigii TaxID=299767 RepID=UPI003F72FF9C
MFKKQTPSLDSLTCERTAVVKPRLYKFPPLQKSKKQSAIDQMVTDEADLNTVKYEQQQTDGFNDGLNRGFAQGMEEGKEEGYQEGAKLGFDDGMRKGLAEGKAQARQQFLHAVQPVDALTEQLSRFLSDLEVRRREELLQLVEKVTRQVIRCELTLHPTQLLTLVEEGLAGLPVLPQQVKVLMNADDFRRINDIEPEKSQQWGLTADADLEYGECRVITESAEIDVGCEHRLEQCMTALQDNLLPEKMHE